MNDVALTGHAPPSRIERLTAALAPATRDSYRNGWRKWEAFARDHGATTLPAHPEALAAFVESLARTGASPDFSVRRARRHTLAGANPARQLSLQPEAVGAVDGGNDMD